MFLGVSYRLFLRWLAAAVVWSCAGIAMQVYGQAPPASAGPAPMADSSRILHIIKADRYNFEKKDSATSLLSLAGHVVLRQQGTYFYADSAVLNQNTYIVEAFGNIHINDGDSLHTYARYLRYKGNEKLAYLRDNVKLQDNKGSVLSTKELNYDMNLGIATYTTGGNVVNKKTNLTSRKARYYDATRDVIFSEGVKLRDKQYEMDTDSLQYNAQSEIATFIAPTTIVTGKRKILARNGYYDMKQGKAFFAERATIIDSTYSIESNEMAFDDKAGLGQFKGNVVYRDTANGVFLLTEQLFANNKSSSFLATEKPLMILKQDQDSVFIAADTLYSGKLTDIMDKRSIPLITDTAGKGYTVPDLKGKDSSMNRFFEAWNHVRIYSDSVQATADSLFYSGTDSAFRLFRNPLVWSNDSQISADTMYLFTQNKKPSFLNAYYNGFIINRLHPETYNQIKGNTINAWFKEGNIDVVRARGKAESVYYATDEEDKFIGMNRSTAEIIEMYFADKKPQRVKFLVDLQGTTYPMAQIPAGQNRIEGFNWQEEKRPKSYFELLGR